MPQKYEIAVIGSMRIGDLIVMLPFFSKLKQIFPESKITMITWKMQCKELLNTYPYIDDIVETDCDKAKLLLRTIKLRNKRYDYLIHGMPFNTLGERILFCLIRAKEKIKFLDSKENPAYKMWLNTLSQLSGKIDNNIVFTQLFEKSATNSEKINEMIEKIKRTGKIAIGIHVSSLNWRSTSWETEKWISLIEYIYRTYNALIIFLGGKDTVAETNEIISKIDYETLNMTGALSLTETAILIKNLNIFICINSGLMNMASAMDVPLICLSGPSAVMWKPFGRNSFEVRKTIKRKYCNPPCNMPDCRWNDKICMKQIHVNDVIEKLNKYFAENK